MTDSWASWVSHLRPSP